MPKLRRQQPPRETETRSGTYLLMMLRFLCLTALLCGIAAAQDRFPLRGIEIVGADSYSKEAIVAATGLELGQSVAEPDFKSALDRLGKLGLFDTFAYRYEPQGDGYKVTFTVSEIGPLYQVQLEGFDDSTEDLVALLKQRLPFFAERVPPVGPMIESIGDALQARWRAQGHDSKVVGSLEEASPDHLVMLFRPQGRLQTISYVAFEGSEVISAYDLQSFFNRIARGEPYSEARLRELLRFNVRPLYEEKGHMGVAFCPCVAEDDPDTLGLRVTVQVAEGDAYVYDEVPLPEIAGLDPERIAKLYPLTSGKPVNMTQAREAQAAIEEALRVNGFIRAQSQIDFSVNEENKTVDLELEVVPGYRYTFDRLHIEGLDILAEPIIRKRWAMASGDPYTPSYPARFMDRLQQEGAFENLQDTRWKEDVDEATKRVSVTLQFIGRTDKRLYPAAASDPIDKPF